jgi:hypothetical protein
VLNSHQIRTEIRPLKNMNVLCRERNCNCVHSANGKTGRAIRREVQAGVDVAIATKILTLACENRLDCVVLLAGDGDFVDAVKYVKETLHKKVFVVAFKDSLSARLMPYAETPNGIIVLDDYADVVAQGATAAIGGAASPPPPARAANGVAARPRSPPSDSDFADSIAPAAPSAADLWAMSLSARGAAPPPSARSPGNNEALVRQLVDVGVADEAACRAALQRANWNMDAALDDLFAKKASQSYAPQSDVKPSPPLVVVAAAAAAAPAARDEPTALLLKLQAQKQAQFEQQQLEQVDQQRKQDLLLKLLKQERVSAEPAVVPMTAAAAPVKAAAPTAVAPAAVKSSPSPPQSVSPKSSSPRSSASSSSPRASTPADYNDVALIHLSNVRELQGMGFETEAANRALHACGGATCAWR